MLFKLFIIIILYSYKLNAQHTTEKDNIFIELELINDNSTFRYHSQSSFNAFENNGYQYELKFICMNNLQLLFQEGPKVDHEPYLIVKLNKQPKNFNYEIVSDSKSLQSISFFLGVLEHSNLFMRVYAIGTIDHHNNKITSLQAIIRNDWSTFYLRPNNLSLKPKTFRHPQSSYIISPDNTTYFHDYFNKQFSAKHLIKRAKRQIINETNCSIVIFIDESLSSRMNHNEGKLTLLIHFVFQTADQIFRNTKFTNSGGTKLLEEYDKGKFIYENYGHVLCKIILPSGWPTMNNVLSFLNGSSSWTQNNLYQALDKLDNHSSYCLAYLFTNLEITNPQANGIATRGGILNHHKYKPNVGAVSFFRCQDPWEYYCSLTFAHELGHSWGAEHDIDSDECIPKNNGSYLMSEPFQYSFGENNFEFSPCSIRAIYRKIEMINPKEFEFSCTKCGNHYLDAGEECDEGEHGGLCCSPHCKLLSSTRAMCSPFNHDCCNERCQVMSAGHVCRKVDQRFCRAESQCNGFNVTCPEPFILPDDTQCYGKGKCSNGYCQSLCPNDHIECDCVKDDQPSRSECKLCCRPNMNMFESNISIPNECIPHSFLPDGSPCFIEKSQPGECYREKCILKSFISTDSTEIQPEPTKSIPTTILFVIYILLLLIFICIVISSVIRKYCSREKLLMINDEIAYDESQNGNPINIYHSYISVPNDENYPNTIKETKL